MSGSVALSIETYPYTVSRGNTSIPATFANEASDSGSPIASRNLSDYTVSLSEQAQQLGSDDSSAEQQETQAEEANETPRQERVEDEAQQQLSEDEQAEVDRLQARDQEVRTHEEAHRSAGGQYAGAPSYSYTQGPDGKRYITDGEVSIDVAKVAGDPQATITKMQQVIRAAMAPAEPSAADHAVAREAQNTISEARAESVTNGNPAPKENSDSNRPDTSSAEPPQANASSANRKSLEIYQSTMTEPRPNIIASA
ncbi:catalase [Maribrevibacterium harenarium]|uniref:Catalase n=1 Tax=Maribrevibacterium harenarium TaxID=2589817 RepID=A0A501X517_9GAMM|nr:putative metalloprotease CJM1_0395 family protein [Maribrevibacterium harenarium]TPE55612.1 catalase [Maribrevibacterium harenarium]